MLTKITKALHHIRSQLDAEVTPAQNSRSEAQNPAHINLDLTTPPVPAAPSPQQSLPTITPESVQPSLEEQLAALPPYSPPATTQVIQPHTALQLMNELDLTGQDILSRTVTELRAGRLHPGEAGRLLASGSPAWQSSTGWTQPLNVSEIVVALQVLRDRPVNAAALCPNCGSPESVQHQQLTARLVNDQVAAIHTGERLRECLSCGLICDDRQFWDIRAGDTL